MYVKSSALLFLLISSSFPAEIVKNVLKGESVTFTGVSYVGNITSMLWKWETSKVAEWEKEDTEPTYYRKFTNRSSLDMKTWTLTLQNLESEFNGLYSLEIDQETRKTFQLTVYESVSKPNIDKKCDSVNCTLTCKGVQSDNISYSWKDNKGNRLSGNVWRVTKSTDLDVVYTCNVSNPVSWNNSSITEREMFPSDSHSVAVVVGATSAVFVVAVAVAVAVIYFRNRQHGSCRNQQQQNQSDAAANQQQGIQLLNTQPGSCQNQQQQNQSDAAANQQPVFPLLDPQPGNAAD
ncbi:CD48 antigen-like isoform X1 [Denticeps clupeoides]|uniref:CD48 antigen-like isoform X1 n=1 Tax=Denticeps clupeoides TaxID=299321 RepID=UPI0010A42137|nr:CD48 antigen-like isoform X1 [Denticeps clupeoides]